MINLPSGFTHDLGLIAYAWLVLLIPQVLVGPLLLKKFQHKLTDGGWIWGKVLAWLTVSLIIWFGGYLKLPINTQQGIYFVSLLFIFICIIPLWKHRKALRTLIWEYKHLIFLEELLFALGFFGLSIVRTFNPNILDLEKFMDNGFIASYLRSPTLPALDMWLAGDTLNYYTFGHFMGNIATRWWGIDLAYSYNLLLGLICGLTLAGSFSVVLNLTRPLHAKHHIVLIFGAIVGAFLVTFGGNTHTFWYWISHHSLENYWYAEATRFIPFTIHEFPAYSFVVSDLHGHVWDLPIVLGFLTTFALWIRDQKLRVAAFMGVLLGVMFMTNTWDTMIYGILLTIYCCGLLIIRPKQFPLLVKTAFVVAISALITALPWMLTFKSIAQGVRLVTSRSELWQLAALWGIHVFLSFIAFLMCVKVSLKDRHLSLRNGLIVAVFITSLILLAIPEIIYFKDIYPNHPRANTMFKFTFQAFILMSLTIGWAITRFQLWPIRKKSVLYIALAAIFLFFINNLFLFPTYAYRNYYNDLKNYQSLNGLVWMQRDYPDDYEAVLWLKSHVTGQVTVVEAVGESYTTFDRVSAMTGLPTILGWRVHEWLWRGGFDIPAARTEEVKTIFEQPTSLNTQALLEKYHVKYIFLGSKEREEYTIDESGLLSLGKVVFQSQTTKIIQLN